MATTGELRAIIEELQLIDVGEAASFLGEETLTAGESHLANQQESLATIPNDELYSSRCTLSSTNLIVSK